MVILSCLITQLLNQCTCFVSDSIWGCLDSRYINVLSKFPPRGGDLQHSETFIHTEILNYSEKQRLKNKGF